MEHQVQGYAPGHRAPRIEHPVQGYSPGHEAVRIEHQVIHPSHDVQPTPTLRAQSTKLRADDAKRFDKLNPKRVKVLNPTLNSNMIRLVQPLDRSAGAVDHRVPRGLYVLSTAYRGPSGALDGSSVQLDPASLAGPKEKLST